jgi:hypothetical protein
MSSNVKKLIRKVENGMWWLKGYHQKNAPPEFRNNLYYAKWYATERAALKKFENLHRGEDCFIVGNGPSLNKMDLSLLNDYHVFGMNKIHMIFEKQKFDLSYHVAVNELVIEQIDEELNANIFGCPSFISYVASPNKAYANGDVYKLLTNGRWSFYHSILEPINEGYTVTYVALQIAFYMGFKNVFLIGVDHNFNQKGKANETQKMEEDDSNHFHPNYFKGHKWQLADLEGSEASYALARHQYHQNGRNIYDATVGGKLTLFEKVDFNDALKHAKRKH